MIHGSQYFQLAQDRFLIVINALATPLIILSIIVGTEKRPRAEIRSITERFGLLILC